ncbi:MAG: DUF4783 domain-containing protein [Ignavibacteria bacterium]|nr:DUF4783 domain-containing protein [Ignavibacteria bacterium]
MYKRTALLFSLVIIFGFISGKDSFSQDKWWKEKKYKSESMRIKYDLCKKTFKDIGNGFQYKNVNNITPYFDTQVYLNMYSSDKGYYSAAQAEQILLDFMDYFTVSNFKYIRSNRFNTYAFVNGIYTYNIGSGKKDLKVAISLKYHNYKWYVDQISVK